MAESDCPYFKTNFLNRKTVESFGIIRGSKSIFKMLLLNIRINSICQTTESKRFMKILKIEELLIFFYVFRS